MDAQTDQIESHIQEVRERMAHRIDAVSKELDAKAFAARFTGKDNPGTGDIIDAVADAARRHPLPIALIGLGLVGIVGSQLVPQEYKERAGAAAGNVSDRAEALGDRLRQRFDEAAASLHAAADGADGSASDLSHESRQKLKQTAESLRAGAHETAEEIRRYARETGEALGEGARRVRQQVGAAPQRAGEVSDWIRENPVASGLMVMAAGAAVASFMTAGRRSDDHAVASQEEAHEASMSLKERAEAREFPDGPFSAKGAERYDGLSRAADTTGADDPLPASQGLNSQEQRRAGESGDASPASVPPAKTAPDTATGWRPA